jgi:hypothetical protein
MHIQFRTLKLFERKLNFQATLSISHGFTSVAFVMAGILFRLIPTFVNIGRKKNILSKKLK